eukprot:TRINITY_DN784_c0_g1_i1.p1 TRINITY_DN784_c0_g1~~TRINITY_DN784_c0_g1_i1.p1  ORF type:complete len:459 (+),score=50.23 TRINITY_DN784_c0_g1_i1:808-2184(+)
MCLLQADFNATATRTCHFPAAQAGLSLMCSTEATITLALLLLSSRSNLARGWPSAWYCNMPWQCPCTGGHVQFLRNLFIITPSATGLTHMGVFQWGSFSAYYTGSNDHGVIMGAAYGKQYSLWSKGDYPGANNKQDNIAIITQKLGAAPDKYGDTFADAFRVDVSQVSKLTGVLGANDTDTFVIKAQGDMNLTLLPYSSWKLPRGSNLYALVSVFDAEGRVLASSSTSSSTGTSSIQASLQPGLYYITLTGSGKPGAFPSYGSSGQYTLSIDTQALDIATVLPTTKDATTAISSSSSVPSSSASRMLRTLMTSTINILTTIMPPSTPPSTSRTPSSPSSPACLCPVGERFVSSRRKKSYKVRFRVSCQSYQFQACLRYPENAWPLPKLRLQYKDGKSYETIVQADHKLGVACLTHQAASMDQIAFRSKWRYRVLNKALVKYELLYTHEKIRAAHCNVV